MLVPEESEKIRSFGAGKEEKNFRGECTQVLDQENFSLTQPAPKPPEGRAHARVCVATRSAAYANGQQSEAVFEGYFRRYVCKGAYASLHHQRIGTTAPNKKRADMAPFCGYPARYFTNC
ncbi:hypothetical protein, partial [uncultured Desulfovibrio sp.]|uniref:hypothetical protein n=1 Tax=uncultured Desulfovibrio sp. TaxID=167968 RepID=UPI00262EE482